jgi:SAM-dependent methyltransferase
LIQYTCPTHGNPFLQYKYKQAESISCPRGCSFPVINNIPRFVSADNYASSFGLQWNTFRKAQLDSYTRTTISRDRLSRILGGLDWLKGKTVLEAGCGAGRFSEVLLEAGALLHSFDLSNAVEAAHSNCGNFPDYRVCQASILNMPFPPESFDVVVCIGVIQHTPNPEESIAALARMVKPRGKLFIDHYAPGYPMPLVRRALRNFLLSKNPEFRMRFCKILRDLLWPLHTTLHSMKLKRLGRKLYHLLFRFSPLVDYLDAYPKLSPKILREWALLDTHDLLTDEYKHLRTTEQIGKALLDSGLEITHCIYAGNGVEAAAHKPIQKQSI